MNRALLGMGFCAMLHCALPARSLAQNQIDVRGGFFSKDEVNRSFFDGSQSAPRKPAGKPAGDSWDIEGQSPPAPPPRGRAPYAGRYDFSDSASGAAESAEAPTQPAPPPGDGGFAVQGQDSPLPAPEEERRITSEDAAVRAASIIETVKEASQQKKLDQASQQLEFLKQAVQNAGNDAKADPLNPPDASKLAFQPAAQRILNIDDDLTPVLSVVVSAEPVNHFSNVIKQLADFKRATGIKTGPIIVVGLSRRLPTRVETGDMAGGRSETPRYPSSVSALLGMFQRASLSELRALEEGVSYSASLEQKWAAYSIEEQARFARKISEPGTEESLASSPDIFSGGSKTLCQLFNSMTDKDRQKLDSITRARMKDWAKDIPGLSEVERTLMQTGLRQTDDADTQWVLRTLQPQLSPVWIVSFRSKEYVFEGDYSPVQFFDSYGNFKPPA